MKIKSCLTQILMVLFGLFLALIVIEVGVRLAYGALPQNLQIILRDVRVTPFTDVRIVPPAIWQSDNDYQTVTRPNLQNVSASGSPEITFPVTTYSWFGGRVGFRSPQPTDGRLDAAVLGDSFSFCFTDNAGCWVTLLAQKTGLNIANMGQPVTGSTSHARIFKTFAAPVKPSLVIWQFFGNDFNDDYGLAELNGTAQTSPDPATRNAPLPTSPLAVWLRENSVIYATISALLRQNQGIDQFIDPYHETIQPGNIDLWYGQSYVQKAFDLKNPRNQEGERLSHAAILETKKQVEGYGGKFVMILIPTKEEIFSANTAAKMEQSIIDQISEPRRRMLAFCKEQSISCLDLYDALRAQADKGIQGYFARDMHLNGRGNEAVAEAVTAFLKNLN